MVEDCGESVFSLCRKLAFSPADAEDLFQDTFLRAVECRDKIDRDGNPRAFLLGLCVKTWQSGKRKFARRQRIAPTQALEEEAISLPADFGDPQEQLWAQERIHALRECCATLDDKRRVVVYLHYGADLSVTEIAAALQLPPGTVKSRLHKARQTLKNEMEARGYETQA